MTKTKQIEEYKTDEFTTEQKIIISLALTTVILAYVISKEII